MKEREPHCSLCLDTQFVLLPTPFDFEEQPCPYCLPQYWQDKTRVIDALRTKPRNTPKGESEDEN